jgi:hypothetical protein
MRTRPAPPVECSCPTCEAHRWRFTPRDAATLAALAFLALIGVPVFLTWCASF